MKRNELQINKVIHTLNDEVIDYIEKLRTTIKMLQSNHRAIKISNGVLNNKIRAFKKRISTLELLNERV